MITMRNVTFILMGFIFIYTSQLCYAKELAGEVVSVTGIAFVRQDGATELPKTPARVKPGDNIYSGDVLNTSSEGSVKILMRDKSVVDLSASSLFKVDEYQHNHGNDRKAKFDLMFGKVRVAVTKKIEGEGSFNVKTHGATMGVRGTEFIVSEAMPERLSKNDKNEKSPEAAKGEAKQATTVTVVQGQVDMKATAVPVKEAGSNAAVAPAPKVVSLMAGMQMSTGGIGAAANVPVKLDPIQMKAIAVESKIADNTFSKAVTIEPMKESSGSSENGRSPSSESGKAPSALANVLAMSAGGGTSGGSLPTIPPTQMPPPDVLGVPKPQDIFVNTTTSNLKHLHVTITSNP
jgi:hypothetical protein